MIRRVLPRSLQGQMLLAVALALLVAQTISGVLLYRAQAEQREAGIIAALAFQLVADPQVDMRSTVGRSNDDRNGHHGRRRFRIEHAPHAPDLHGHLRDESREARLSRVLTEQGVEVGQLIVASRPVRSDSYIMRGLRNRPALGGPERWDPDGELILAALKSVGSAEWQIARVPRAGPEHRMFGGVVMQTLVLYIVIVGGLALLLRRITRPLAALTRRVEQFGTPAAAQGPLEPSGPDDTRRLIDAHNAMESRIAALLDEKDVMLGAIGHDLKTPLAALRVRIESVEDEGERARMAATIEDITNSLDDILSLARVGRPSDPLERTDLAALISSVVEEYEDMGEPVTMAESERMAAELRATWMRRALRNLIGNALRYGHSAHVTLEREETSALIRIADQGPGIPEDQIAAMLEPFARGEASRNRETGGAGLGLTLARAIAEQHGGSLVLANRPEGGLLAELRVPLVG